MRIQIDFDAVGDAASALTGATVAPLAETPPSGRATLDAGLLAVRDGWASDPLPGDVVETGSRLAASAADLRAAEETALAAIRSIEAALG